MKLHIKIYHIWRQIIETRILGTRFNELIWRYRHVYKQGWAAAYISANSFSHPHRQLLIQRISDNFPFTDVLEIGCASGPNLYLLAKKFPSARFVGIDINSEAVRKGNALFRQQGISNVSLFVGMADRLERFSDKSFDIVFTDAVLVCIGADKIKKVAREILRVARKAIILVEYHSEQQSELGSIKQKRWLRNYTKLFHPFSRQINITKIPPEIWGETGGDLGISLKLRGEYACGKFPMPKRLMRHCTK